MRRSGATVAAWVGVLALQVLWTVLFFANGSTLLGASVMWGLLVGALVLIRTKWFYRIVLRRMERNVKAPDEPD